MPRIECPTAEHAATKRSGSTAYTGPSRHPIKCKDGLHILTRERRGAGHSVALVSGAECTAAIAARMFAGVLWALRRRGRGSSGEGDGLPILVHGARVRDRESGGVVGYGQTPTQVRDATGARRGGETGSGETAAAPWVHPPHRRVTRATPGGSSGRRLRPWSSIRRRGQPKVSVSRKPGVVGRRG